MISAGSGCILSMKSSNSRCLLHRFLVERIGGLRRTDDYSVASECRVRFNAVALVQQLVAAFVH